MSRISSSIGGNGSGGGDASTTVTNTTNFNKLLTSSETTVQKALDKLDDHVHTATDITDFDAEVSNNSDVSNNTTHRNTTSGNPHNVTYSDVGALSDTQQYSSNTRTINISAGSSVSTIQSILDNANHYIAPGETVTVQFEDGTYTLSDTIYIRGWYGGGRLIIQGNTSDETKVVIDGSGHGNQVFHVNGDFNNVFVRFYYLTIKSGDVDSYSNALYFIDQAYGDIWHCALEASGTSNARVVHTSWQARITIGSTTISKGSIGVFAGYGSQVMCHSVSNGAAQPGAYGILSYASDVHRYNVSLTGGTADTYVSAGGNVW